MAARASRQILFWMLYDFANSFVIAVFGVYFSQWLVVDHQVSDLSFNLIFIASSLLLLLSAPLFGVIVDKLGVKLPSLRLSTAFSFLTLLGSGLLAVFAEPTGLVISLVIGFLIAGQYFYQLSYVFYNPLLKELAPPEEQSKISGYGAASGGLGQIIGLLVTLPLASGAIYLIGHHDESQVFLPTAILFILLTLPLLVFFRERAKAPAAVNINGWEEFRGIFKQWSSLGAYPGLKRFLLAYFFFNDAVLTAAHNFPIYIQQLFATSSEERAIALGVIILAAAAGALGGGWIASITGEKRLLTILLGIWVVILPVTALQRQLIPFIICLVFVGLLAGATAALSRSFMVKLAPPREITHAFGYYAMAERLASFLGPLGWGIMTYGFYSHGVIRYQLALASMSIFILVGFFLLRGVQEHKPVVNEG